jgi:hypothetical protein
VTDQQDDQNPSTHQQEVAVPTFTENYSRIHDALLDAATLRGLRPWDVRVLVALEERGGRAVTDQLQDDLRDRNGAQVRRSLITLYAQDLATGQSSRGGPRRAGQRSVVTLTFNGRAIARDVLRTLYLEGERDRRAA